MLRSAVEAIGGYDPTLRARGCEGAEDFLLYLRIAEQYEFALVPDLIVAYRDRRGNMSDDVDRMVRSRDLCVLGFRQEYPELADAIEEGRMRFLRFMVGRCLRERRIADAARLTFDMVRQSPADAAFSLIELGKERFDRCKKYLGGKYQPGRMLEL
jgi:hypothetical protein